MTDREVLNLGARLDAIEKKILARLDQQVNAMTGRLERIECKVDGLDAQILPAGTDADTGPARVDVCGSAGPKLKGSRAPGRPVLGRPGINRAMW